jgi:microcystin-dependent protein
VTEPFLGEIRPFAFAFAPRNWALCNGQLLPLNQNQALFALLGTMYGGNGVNTFQLPDLRARTPVGGGSSVDAAWQPAPMMFGQTGGQEAHTLTIAELPSHSHTVQTTAAATTGVPRANVVLASTVTSKPYRSGATATVPTNPALLANTGLNSSHPNMQPFTVLSFAIALAGIFPSRN